MKTIALAALLGLAACRAGPTKQDLMGVTLETVVFTAATFALGAIR